MFVDWHPRIDASIDGVKLECIRLKRLWERSSFDQAAADPGPFGSPKSAAERPPAPDFYATTPMALMSTARQLASGRMGLDRSSRSPIPRSRVCSPHSLTPIAIPIPTAPLLPVGGHLQFPQPPWANYPKSSSHNSRARIPSFVCLTVSTISISTRSSPPCGFESLLLTYRVL